RHKHPTRIHIDQKPYNSPNPTTGAALYLLGNLSAEFELYREVKGNREDSPIENGPEVIHLKEDEHFHSAPAREKEITIIVNGQKKVVKAKELSFAEVVALAFSPVPTGPDVMFTITFQKGPHPKAEGHLYEGATVKIKNGMIFNVTSTNKS
ncbi:MAG TPA: multiubiquitin domain-containing protein, partial [Anaerolineales bacterium]|nr:multiubiquitin domain-containing protein [Anaerolineales bacterium]